MQLTVFNQSSSTEIQPLLMRCVNIPSWSQSIEQMRPFHTKSELLHVAKTLAEQWQWQEILNALNDHPKIGEKSITQESADQTDHSAKEQANISMSLQDKEALLHANIAYQNKFGFIFLIKAMGLKTQEVLKQIELRLQHDIDTEKKCVHEQLILITLLRLEQEIV